MLLDTSGLLCFLNENEPKHERAVELVRAANFPLLTHSYILAEIVALSLVRKFSRKIVLDYIKELLDNPDIIVIWVDSAINQAAIELLLARFDKTYSLCDAVSFVLMRERKIDRALTTDHHFSQEGFLRLL